MKPKIFNTQEDIYDVVEAPTEEDAQLSGVWVDDKKGASFRLIPSEYEVLMNNPNKIISLIRNSFPQASIVYTRGSCGQFYKILKEIFPSSQAFIDGDHIITKIDDKFYDINGVVKCTKGFLPCKDNEQLLLNKYMGDLEYIQCPNCDEVYRYLIKNEVQ